MSQALENYTVRMSDEDLENLSRNVAKLHAEGEVEHMSRAEAIRRLVASFNQDPDADRLQ